MDVEIAQEQQRLTLEGHTVLIGYGRVGSLVGEELKARKQDFIVIEDSDKIAARLKESGIPVITGNAVKIEILALANIPASRRVIIAVSNVFEAGQIIERSRAMNGLLEIVAYSYSKDEADYLMKLGSSTVIVGNREVARGMVAQAFGAASA